MKNGICSICHKEINTEDASILTMGNFGTPRYLCEECDELLQTATLGKSYEEISEACDKISTTLSNISNDDEVVLSELDAILTSAAERAKEIAAGTYDFTLDEATECEGEEEGIPEELKESEEDRALDEKEAKANKVIDTVISWISAAILIGVLAYFIFTYII